MPRTTPPAPSERAARWHHARRTARDNVLTAVARSRWAADLVLHGDALLKAWFGEAAREPGGLDFVVRPETWLPSEPRTTRMLDEVARSSAAVAAEHGVVRIDEANVRCEETRVRGRKPGRRLTLRWHAEGLPPGAVHVDFAFTERLPVQPEFALLPGTGTDGATRIAAATPELSLAWKLRRLLSDGWSPAKDLYDAVLLAEAVPLPVGLLMRTLVAAEPHWAGRRFVPEMVDGISVDAAELRRKFPDTAAVLHERLKAALAPTLAESAAVPPTDGYRWRAVHLAPCIEQAREVLRGEGMDAVLALLEGASMGMPESIVTLREAVGADRCGTADAAATLIEFHQRQAPDRYSWSNPADHVEKALFTLRETV
ncbi:nucleotidyl transferase AbiEii/AbiGii toxin family protein [Yinghuangia seranimata]|uniref:nucleotidyl transferase AbiEii/AbiGii toxin family protein n=1 Tax=Yinghuangia seranimata TaxID=408067 RepID=UPI00248AD6FA|nr:nucleotidyl transferase AbiEii/AbiGii toxin family protein [Yinghuangia seranimata]MDI2131568.1 nucleotidyl transferase AbiEii/AbiGii toxin family protein [Yinghuangia seranimata]